MAAASIPRAACTAMCIGRTRCTAATAAASSKRPSSISRCAGSGTESSSLRGTSRCSPAFPPISFWRRRTSGGRAAWRMIRARPELSFFIVTKRILRFSEGLPADWGDGYENVTLCCTVENRRRAAERLPHFFRCRSGTSRSSASRCSSVSACRPISARRLSGCSSAASPGRRRGCATTTGCSTCAHSAASRGVPFCLPADGARFRKDGRVYAVERREQHRQAKKANIDIK